MVRRRSAHDDAREYAPGRQMPNCPRCHPRGDFNVRRATDTRGVPVQSCVYPKVNPRRDSDVGAALTTVVVVMRARGGRRHAELGQQTEPRNLPGRRCGRWQPSPIPILEKSRGDDGARVVAATDDDAGFAWFRAAAIVTAPVECGEVRCYRTKIGKSAALRANHVRAAPMREGGVPLAQVG